MMQNTNTNLQIQIMGLHNVTTCNKAGNLANTNDKICALRKFFVEINTIQYNHTMLGVESVLGNCCIYFTVQGVGKKNFITFCSVSSHQKVGPAIFWRAAEI